MLRRGGVVAAVCCCLLQVCVNADASLAKLEMPTGRCLQMEHLANSW